VSSDDIDPSEFETDSEDAGPPLTATDLPKVRAELTEWMDAREFQRRVHGFDKRSRPSTDHFNDPERKFLREAWVLAELSKHNQFVQIRLADVKEEPPDGFARPERLSKLRLPAPGFRVAAWAMNIVLKNGCSMIRLKTVWNEPSLFPRRWKRPLATN